jgi:hypothetical protein
MTLLLEKYLELVRSANSYLKQIGVNTNNTLPSKKRSIQQPIPSKKERELWCSLLEASMEELHNFQQASADPVEIKEIQLTILATGSSLSEFRKFHIRCNIVTMFYQTVFKNWMDTYMSPQIQVTDHKRESIHQVVGTLRFMLIKYCCTNHKAGQERVLYMLCRVGMKCCIDESELGLVIFQFLNMVHPFESTTPHNDDIPR